MSMCLYNPYLVAVIAKDLELLDEFKEIPRNLPPPSYSPKPGEES